jgi:hypothetical protein
VLTCGALGFAISDVGVVIVCLALVWGIKKGIWNLATWHLIRQILDGYKLNWSIVESDVCCKGAPEELRHRRRHWPQFAGANRVVTMVWNLLFLAFRFVCFIPVLLNFTDFSIPVPTEGPGPIKGLLLTTSGAKLWPTASSSTRSGLSYIYTFNLCLAHF